MASAPWNERRLVSLWDFVCWLDMEPFKAATFYKIGRLLERVATVHGSKWRPGEAFYGEMANVPQLDEALTDADKDGLRSFVEAMRVEIEKIKLARSTEYAVDILRQLNESSGITNRKIAILLQELDKHIRWDMEKERFMYIPPSSAKYYKLEKPFGEAVYDAYPGVRFDLTQAGNCLAAGVYTASGLHLMRGAEVGLWELGRDRQIPLAQSGKIEFAEWG